MGSKTSAERNLKAIKIEEEAKKKRASTKTTNILAPGMRFMSERASTSGRRPVLLGYIAFRMARKYGRFHYGTDIGCATGTRIVAMADGVVTYVGWPGSNYNWAYGKMIVINHYDGSQTRYGHLSAFNCHMGQKVKAGQVIGYTGNTGRSSGPHLHFEIRVNGKHVNPMNYFKRTR